MTLYALLSLILLYPAWLLDVSTVGPNPMMLELPSIKAMVPAHFMCCCTNHFQPMNNSFLLNSVHIYVLSNAHV